VIDCEYSRPCEPNGVDSRRPSGDMEFSRAAETDAVRRILILDKTVRPIPNSGARNAPPGKPQPQRIPFQI